MAIGARARAPPSQRPRALPRAATGIDGFDALTEGGLPRGRPTLVCGGAGSGKTLFAMEFLARGARQFDEPGVFVAFEESPADLRQNFESIGFDLGSLEERKLLVIEDMRIRAGAVVETGNYDLEPLFARIGAAVDDVGAKRVVLDTVEVLFARLESHRFLRAELQRLFGWLKDRGLTAIITGERGEGSRFSRYGLEEYVADCVIALDHPLENAVSTRTLRVLKYRGGRHGTNEYPFFITEHGISIAPITSLVLEHSASEARVSTGIPDLDGMLGGKGYFAGSSILASGTSGTGKTSVAASFVDGACARGERALFLSFEESPAQLVRNMRSIGIDLQRWVDQGRLVLMARRATAFGPESHLLEVERLVRETRPSVVALDPITSLTRSGPQGGVQALVTRLVDTLKSLGITAVFTALLEEERSPAAFRISSVIDTWIHVRAIEANGERTRGIYVLKSRGMTHSNQIRELLLTDDGIRLVEVDTADGSVVTGTERAIRVFEEKIAAKKRERALDRDGRLAEQRTRAITAQIAALEATRAWEAAQHENKVEDARFDDEVRAARRARIAAIRRPPEAGEQDGEDGGSP